MPGFDRRRNKDSASAAAADIVSVVISLGMSETKVSADCNALRHNGLNL